MPEVITSTGNATVKCLVRLARAEGRRADGAFLVEGRRAIAAFLAAGWQPRRLYLRADLERPPEWPESAVQGLAAPVCRRVSQHRTASGYLAEFPLPTEPRLDPAAGGLVCAGIADPGNLGTLVRSAAAFGLDQVVVLGGADPYAPKVVQASAGALARVRLARLDDLGPLAGGAPCVALLAAGGAGVEAFPAGPAWIVAGSEAHGVPVAALAACDRRVTLPMPGGTESLNAGIAGSIACFLAAGLHRPG